MTVVLPHGCTHKIINAENNNEFLRQSNEEERERGKTKEVLLLATMWSETDSWQRYTWMKEKHICAEKTRHVDFGNLELSFFDCLSMIFFLYACVNNHVLLFFVATGNTFIYHTFMACC